MTTEQQFPSVRGLVDLDLGPLRKFTGVLDSCPEEDKQSKPVEGRQQNTYTIMHLNYKDMEVIETTEPYTLPIFTIDLPKSNRKRSKYGVFGTSLTDILDMQYNEDQLNPANPAYIPPSKRADLKDVIGKRVGMVLADGEEGRPAAPELWDSRANDGKGGEVPTQCWMVFSVEGIGTAGGGGEKPLDRAMALLDGKNQQEFSTAAYGDDVVKSSPELIAAIAMPASAANSFCNMMVSTGKFTKDEAGVYHKV